MMAQVAYQVLELVQGQWEPAAPASALSVAQCLAGLESEWVSGVVVLEFLVCPVVRLGL